MKKFLLGLTVGAALSWWLYTEHRDQVAELGQYVMRHVKDAACCSCEDGCGCGCEEGHECHCQMTATGPGDPEPPTPPADHVA